MLQRFTGPAAAGAGPMKTAHTVASLLIVGAIAAAAVDASPPAARQHAPAAVYRLAGAVAADMPVFTLGDDGFPVQAGRARADGGHLTVVPYAGAATTLSDAANTAILFDADLRSLWALLPDRQRQELHGILTKLVASLRAAVRRTLQSPLFESQYRPILRDVLDRALSRAVAAPAARDAWLAAVASADPKAIDDLVTAIRPVALDKAESVLWDAVSGLLAPFSRNDKDRGAMAQVVTETLKDSRSHEAFARTLPKLVGTREMNAFVSVLAGEVGSAMLEDERLLSLLNRMIGDAEVVSDADTQLLGNSAQTLLHALPAKFIGLRHEGDHNALASFVLTTLAKGRHGRFVVVAEPDHARRLVAVGGTGLRILPRAEP